jgi:hypothetical protein
MPARQYHPNVRLDPCSRNSYWRKHTHKCKSKMMSGFGAQVFDQVAKGAILNIVTGGAGQGGKIISRIGNVKLVGKHAGRVAQRVGKQ